MWNILVFHTDVCNVLLDTIESHLMIRPELRSLFHRTKVPNLFLVVLRITVNPLLCSILERTNGDRISETPLYI